MTNPPSSGPAGSSDPAERVAGMLSPQAIDALLADAEAAGTAIDGPDGLLAKMTKAVLERALDELFQGVIASVVIGGEAAGDGGADAVVVPDRHGEGQDALQHADPDPSRGVSAVLFEVELAFEGVVDRLDDLA